MVDPLLRSATASSAFSNNFEAARSIVGARVGCSIVVDEVEYLARGIDADGRPHVLW
jgi:hypothetical protein